MQRDTVSKESECDLDFFLSLQLRWTPVHGEDYYSCYKNASSVSAALPCILTHDCSSACNAARLPPQWKRWWLQIWKLSLIDGGITNHMILQRRWLVRWNRSQNSLENQKPLVFPELLVLIDKTTKTLGQRSKIDDKLVTYKKSSHGHQSEFSAEMRWVLRSDRKPQHRNAQRRDWEM